MIASILERIYCVGGKVVVLARDFDKDALIALVLRPFADAQEVIDVVALVVVELHRANAVNLLQHLHQLQGQLLQALSRTHGTRTGKVHLLYTHLRCATTHQILWAGVPEFLLKSDIDILILSFTSVYISVNSN